MRRAWITLLVLACGSRADLSAPPNAPSPSGCTDLIEAGAFRPVERYCSDNSRRAPAALPRGANVLWTRDFQGLNAPGPLIVDAQGHVIIMTQQPFEPLVVHAVRAEDGADAWSAQPDPYVSDFEPLYTAPDGFRGTHFDAVNDFATVGVLSFVDGSVVTNAPWNEEYASVRIGADESLLVEMLASDIDLDNTFAGIARIEGDGTRSWSEAARCDPGETGAPPAHDFLRRGDHLVVVCNLRGGESVEVREVDAQDHIVSDQTVDVGGLASEAVLAPNGDVSFFTSLQDGSSSLVTLSANGVSVGGPSLPLNAAPFDALMAPLAVARDGTLVVVTPSSIVAVANGAVRWSQPIAARVPATNLVLDDSTVVAADSAYDLASGAVLWSSPGGAIAIASAGPGKMYMLNGSTLALLASP